MTSYNNVFYKNSHFVHSCCTALRNAGILEIQLSLLNIIKQLDDRWTDLDLDAKYSIRNHNFVHFLFYFPTPISVCNVHKKCNWKEHPECMQYFVRSKLLFFRLFVLTFNLCTRQCFLNCALWSLESSVVGTGSNRGISRAPCQLTGWKRGIEQSSLGGDMVQNLWQMLH